MRSIYGIIHKRRPRRGGDGYVKSGQMWTRGALETL